MSAFKEQFSKIFRVFVTLVLVAALSPITAWADVTVESEGDVIAQEQSLDPPAAVDEGVSVEEVDAAAVEDESDAVPTYTLQSAEDDATEYATMDDENVLTGGETIGDGEYTLSGTASGTITIKAESDVVITGTGSGADDPAPEVLIQCGSGVHLTISDVKLAHKVTGNKINFTGGDNTLTISGENLIEQDTSATGYAMIHVPNNASLLVNGDGTLYFYKSEQGSGFGGDSSEMNGAITFGDAGNGSPNLCIFGKGSKQGAVIGAGANASGTGTPGDITFNSGTYTLIANARGALIGGSAGSGGASAGGKFVVNGGSLNLNVDFSGAAIGGGGYAEGNDSSGGYVFINGGSIRSFVDTNAVSRWTSLGVTTSGVTDKVITALKTNSAYGTVDPATEADYTVSPLAILPIDTSLLSTPATGSTSFTVTVDGAAYNVAGLHMFRYVNEDTEKDGQTAITDTRSNWVYNTSDGTATGTPNDPNLYLYASKLDSEGNPATHEIVVNGETYTATWDADAGAFTVEKQASTVEGYEWYLTPAGENTYTISNAAELAEFATVVNGTAPEAVGQDSFAGATVTLAGDIDLNAVADWTPIAGNATQQALTIASQEDLAAAIAEHGVIWDDQGVAYSGSSSDNAYSADRSYYYWSGPAFAGTFDGAGKTISGLTITTGTGGYKGLFGSNNGTIKDLTVSGTIGTAESYITSGADNIGGVVGYNNGTVEGVTGDVSVFVKTNSIYAVGGIVGQNGPDGLISQCINTANVTGTKCVGGVVGRTFGTVSQCANTGDITGNSGSGKDGIGGIAGMGGNKGAVYANAITGCYSTGAISNPNAKWVGGIAGMIDGATTVKDCFATGTVSGYGQYNPIIGQSEGTVDNCYCLDTTVTNDADGVYSYSGTKTNCAALTADEMKAGDFVLTLNKSGAWFNADNDGDEAINGGFPILKWQGGTEVVDPRFAPWDGSLDFSWYDESDPKTEYHISTPAQWASIAWICSEHLGQLAEANEAGLGEGTFTNGNITGITGTIPATQNYFTGVQFYLDNDIDMGGVQAEDGTWSGPNYYPIGCEGKNDLGAIGSFLSVFFGNFDGQGHYVNNIYCNRGTSMSDQCVGLFGRVGQPDNDRGGVWGGKAYDLPSLTIENVGITGYIQGGRSVGGIVGKTLHVATGNSVTIQNCVNRAEVHGSQAKGTGGICGAFWNKPLMYNCYSVGTAQNGYPLGSIVGGNEGKIYNAYTTQPLTITGEQAGGDVPYNSYIVTDDTMSGSYRGTVIATADAKLASFADTLGWAYVADTENVNGGYPLLFWEAGLTETDVKQDLSDAVVSFEDDQSFTYTGSAITPSPVVTLGEGDDAVELTAGTDFTVTYEDNVDVTTDESKAKITKITGINGYYGSIDVAYTFDITARSIEDAIITAIPTQWSDGTAAAEPAMTVRLSNPGATLKIDQDYTVEWANNLPSTENKELEATVTLTGTGNYTGTASATFQVRLMSASLSGEGTEASPYIISSQEDLEFVSQMVNSSDADTAAAYAAADYKVGADFTATNIDPVGISTAKPFKGTIDGDGHTITMDQTRANSYTALVGFAIGTAATDDADADPVVIKNLTIEGSVTGTSYTAAFVGYASGTPAIEFANCVNKAAVASVSGAYQQNYAAGFVAQGGTMANFDNCLNAGAISANQYAAGFVAQGGGVFTECANTGSVTAASNYAGGFFGRQDKASVFEACYNAGAVSGGQFVAGFTGYQINVAAEYADVYNIGTVAATNNAAGIVGYSQRAALNITNAYSSGTIEATGANVGALLGYLNSRNTTVSFDNAYWLDGTVAGAYCAGGTNPTVTGDPEAVTADALAGLPMVIKLGDAFNMDNSGEDAINGGYPILVWQGGTPAAEVLADMFADLPEPAEVTLADMDTIASLREAVDALDADTRNALPMTDYVKLVVDEYALSLLYGEAAQEAAEDLADAIDEANADLAATADDTAVENLSTGDEYASSEAKEALAAAIEEAESVLADSEATLSDLESALDDLAAAKAAFDSAKSTVTVDKSALASAIAAAKAAESGVATSTDGSNVADGKQWTTAAAKSAQDKAIAAAQKVADNASATQAQVDAAVTAINKATSTYNSAKTLWHRVWGSNALDTMKNIAARFGTTSTAIVTTNADYKDALAASGLAGAKGALVLTTAKGSLSSQTAAALKSAGVTNVIVVGSTGDVSDATLAAIKKVSGVKSVTRVSGSSASAKAIAAAKKAGKKSDTVIIATQNGFKDALSIAPYAYATKSPILYAETNKTLGSATTSYIKSAGYKKAIIVGGPIALPTSIDKQLKSAGVTSVTRLAGGNAYKTSLNIAKWATGQLANGNYDTYKGAYITYVKFQPTTKMSADKLAVSTGQNWKDALCGAALVGKNKSVLLLGDAKTSSSNYSNAVSFCKGNKASIKTAAYVLGGTSAVNAKVWNALVASTK